MVGCEESQIVTEAFRKKGHEAFSCDILETSGQHPEWHIQGDVLEQLDKGWDMGIFFPPCTYLSNAGIGWFNEKKYGQKAIERKMKRIKALEFFKKLYAAPIKKICIENPAGWANSTFRKPDQVIQPYFFGDNHLKGTCLWLRGLPKLIHIKENDLFYKKTHLPKPEPISIQQRKPSKYYKGGEEKKRYFTDAFSRNAKIRSKTFPGIANAFADQWS